MNLLHTVTFKHPIIITLLVILLIGQVGCSHRPVTVPKRPAPLSESVRAQLGTIGVASARVSPEVDVRVAPVQNGTGTGDGAAEGAMTGAAVGAGGALALLPYGMIFPPILIVAGVIFGVSAIGGALAGEAYGPVEAEPAAPAQAAEGAFRAASADPKVQVALPTHVFRTGRTLPFYKLVLLRDYDPSYRGEEADYRVLLNGGMNTLLVVQVESLSLTAEEDIDPLLALDMAVTSTLVRTLDGVKLDERTFACRAGKRTFNQWSDSHARPFTAGLSNCYKKVADRVAEELFLVYQPPEGVTWRFGGKDFATVEVESLQPTFQWGVFTLLGEEEADELGLLGDIRHVTYDLKVWRTDTNNLPGDLIYLREEIPTSIHTIEQPFEPATKYFWTVRARFDLDGHTRVTPWAVTRYRKGYAPSTFDRVTNPFYYHFTTPSD